MRKSKETGRYILSAGEIGAYTVCPESWRLRSIAKKASTHTESAVLGKKLHAEWAEGIDESVYLSKRVRTLLILLLLTTFAYGTLRIVGLL